jgi:hypothetical protein
MQSACKYEDARLIPIHLRSSAFICGCNAFAFLHSRLGTKQRGSNEKGRPKPPFE